MRQRDQRRKFLRILPLSLALFGALIAAIAGHHGSGRTWTPASHGWTAPVSISDDLARMERLFRSNVTHAEETSPRVHGVVREVNGGPIAGAAVCASCARCDPALLASTTQCAETDANGAYSLEGLAAGEYLLSASADGYVPTNASASEFLLIGEEAGAAVLEVDVELEKGGALVSGVVMDALGGMVGGATVRAVSVTSRRRGEMRIQTSVSDDQGRFSLTAAPGSVVLSAFADGYAPTEVDRTAPSSGVELVVTPASSIRGRVLTADGRDPVAGLQVLAEGPPWSRERATTDDDGRFDMATLRPGVYSLRAKGDGWSGAYPTTVRLDLLELVEDVVLLVRPAVHVQGRLTVGQSPCAEGRVHLRPATGDFSIPRLQSPADGKGSVVFEAVPPGKYMVSASCKGFQNQTLEPLEVGNQDLSGVGWVIEPRLTLGGRVVGPDGTPVGGLPMYLVSEASMFGRTGAPVKVRKAFRTESDGSFSFKGLSRGTYGIKAEYLDAPVEVELSPKTSPVELELVVKPTGNIVVSVATPRDEPVDGLTVYATGEGTDASRRAYQATPQGGGRYRLGPVGTGAYAVYVSDNLNPRVRVGGASGLVHAPPSGTAQVTVEFGGFGGRLTGRVIDDTGAPIANAYVSVAAKGADGSPLALHEQSKREQEVRGRVTDVEGTFELAGLAEDGVFEVVARRAQGGQSSIKNVEPGSDVEIVLPQVGSISGRAVDADGKPAEQFWIAVTNPDTKEQRSESFAHGDGSWEMDSVSPGSIQIAARSIAGNHGRAELTLEPGERRTDIHLELTEHQLDHVQRTGARPD